MKSNLKVISTLIGPSLFLGACSAEKFLYFDKFRTQTSVSFEKNVREIRGGDAVDMLWVIDNSGSMEDHQQRVIDNTRVFIENFSKSTLKWKMGLISTDPRDEPYIGFTASTSLDSSTPDPVSTFQNAVGELGTSGSGTEQPFLSVLRSLQRMNKFARPGVPFALMMVTDAQEQSGMDFTRSFLPQFLGSIGDSEKFFTYNVLNANDLGCDGEDGMGWNYSASPYQFLIDSATVGKVFSLCGPGFGNLMAQIGNEIVQNVSFSTIHLPDRPKLSSIEVIYKGEVLPGGAKAERGFWLYDFDLNAITFHDLEFATDATDRVTVRYDVDDGYRD
jgi:hypothetical protein